MALKLNRLLAAHSMPTLHSNGDDESRLEKSKMSFGEHLEELRSALFKSVIALFLGFLLGLWVGNDVVAYIQTPLSASLERFYFRQAEAKREKRIEEIKARGGVLPEGYSLSASDLESLKLMPQEFYMAPQDFAALLKQVYPNLAKQLEGDKATIPPAIKQPADKAAASAADEPITSRDQMLSLRVYQPVEEDVRLRVIALNAQEPFMVYIHSAFITGLIFSSPFIFYFIWEFIAAGLYRREQRYVYTYLPLSVALFVAGAALAFFFAFQPLLDFLLWYYERMHVDPNMRLSEWISLVLLMTLGFGVAFQLPLGMVLLERIGIFTRENYWRRWRAAVVVIAILAAVLTPSPDPYSMLLMGVPMTLLYFGGIWLCKILPGTSLNAPPRFLKPRG
jgi:sec-independent protein translocase protein TatC